MNRFIAKNRFILLLLSVIICLSCAYGLTAKLDPEVNAIGEKVSASDYSWATIADAAARYLNMVASPADSNGEGVETPGYQTGFAGNYLGYVAVENGTKYPVAAMEANTTLYSYTSLKKLDAFMNKSAGKQAWKQSAQIYSGFGYALTSSGIDEPVIIGQMADDKRNVVGPIVLIVFLLCMALPQFFEMVLTFLSVANPFRLFIGSGSILNSITPGIAAGAGFDNQSSAISAAMSNALTTLSNTVTGLYNALYSLSFFVVIPIMIALALFSWLVLQKKDASSIFRKLATRVVFIGLGVPLLLACYTAAIDSVKDFTINTATGTPITIIASTFCDYGSWALGITRSGYDYMRLPDGVTLKVNESKDSYVYDNTSTSDRRLVQAINDDIYEFNFTRKLSDTMSATDIAKDDAALVNSVAGTAPADKTSAVINMLQSYTKGEYITASNLATKFNASSAGNHTDDKLKFNALSTDWQLFDPKRAIAASYQDANDASVTIPEEDVKDFAQKRLNGAGMSPWVNTFFTSSTPSFSMSGDEATFTGGNFAPMSRLAAYNLLSSTFSDTAISVYSATAASTNQVQLAHYSVSIAGQGYMEYAYIGDAIAIMACLMVLGYGYGFALLFACFKGLIQIFPKVLTGMIGSMKCIAGSCALVAALIIEILGTCIMYALSSMLIGGIYELIEGPLAVLLTSVVNLPPQAAALITVFASAVIIIKLTALLLKYRTAVVKSVSETATGFINKFMETNVVAPNLESGISAGGLASAGLGLAMVAGSSPVGSKLADRASELTDKVTNADADKVATAALGGNSSSGKYGEKYANPNDAKAASGEHSTSSSLAGSDSGGVYSNGSNSLADSSDNTKTPDDLASDYVDNNTEDFKSEIGLASKTKAGDGSETSKDYKVDGNDKDITSDDNDEADTGKSNKSGKSLVDNSTEELTGTKTTDVTATSSEQTGNASASNKMVMKDKNGNEEEVSIVNAKTGNAYTQADKDAGENYDVIGSDGKSVYANKGKLTGGMSANTIAMKDGEAVMMMGPGSDGTKNGLNSYGGGTAYTLSPASTSVQTNTTSGTIQAVQSMQTAPVTAAASGTTVQQSSSAIPAAVVTAGAVAAGTVQNVSQTNVSQTTMNTSQTEQVSQNNNQTTQQVNSGNSGSPVNVNVTASAGTASMGVPIMNGQPGNTYVNVNAPSQSGNSGSVTQAASSREVVNNTESHTTIEREVSSGRYAQNAPSQNVNITNQTNVNASHTSVNSGESTDSPASLGTGSIRNNRRR